VDPDDPESDEEDDPSYLNDTPPLSNTFKFMMNAQLALILFLAIFWLYERGGGRSLM
jgi:hypothetical protein